MPGFARVTQVCVCCVVPGAVQRPRDLRAAVRRGAPAGRAGPAEGAAGVRGERVPRGDALALREDPVPRGRLLLRAVVDAPGQIPQVHFPGQDRLKVERRDPRDGVEKLHILVQLEKRLG